MCIVWAWADVRIDFMSAAPCPPKLIFIYILFAFNQVKGKHNYLMFFFNATFTSHMHFERVVVSCNHRLLSSNTPLYFFSVKILSKIWGLITLKLHLHYYRNTSCPDDRVSSVSERKHTNKTREKCLPHDHSHTLCMAVCTGSSLNTLQ